MSEVFTKLLHSFQLYMFHILYGASSGACESKELKTKSNYVLPESSASSAFFKKIT